MYHILHGELNNATPKVYFNWNTQSNLVYNSLFPGFHLCSFLTQILSAVLTWNLSSQTTPTLLCHSFFGRFLSRCWVINVFKVWVSLQYSWFPGAQKTFEFCWSNQNLLRNFVDLFRSVLQGSSIRLIKISTVLEGLGFEVCFFKVETLCSKGVASKFLVEKFFFCGTLNCAGLLCCYHIIPLRTSTNDAFCRPLWL